MLSFFSPKLFSDEKDVPNERYESGVINESSTIFQNSEVVRVSTMMCGFLLLRILRPSTPMIRQSNESVFRSQVATVYLHTLSLIQ